MSKATLTIRFNSSYVLIGTTSDRLGTGAARPPAPRLSILYCQCAGCPYLGHPQMLPLVTPESLRSGIPTLKYAVKYRIPFGRLVEPTSGICNTCPLFWGTGIELYFWIRLGERFVTCVKVSHLGAKLRLAENSAVR